MKPFVTHCGLVAPLDRENIDTDAIIPKQFMKSVLRTGFGPHLFDGWRYLDAGELGMDLASRPLNTDFVLNQPRFRDASILLAGRNFGCGSSREHAPWALDQYGFRVLIAPSFADIFMNNCMKNGLLTIVLPDSEIAALFDEVGTTPGYQLTVDLGQQIVVKPSGANIAFSVDPFRRQCMLQGMDEIGLTLTHAADIERFETAHLRQRPWLMGGQ